MDSWNTPKTVENHACDSFPSISLYLHNDYIYNSSNKHLVSTKIKAYLKLCMAIWQPSQHSTQESVSQPHWVMLPKKLCFLVCKESQASSSFCYFEELIIYFCPDYAFFYLLFFGGLGEMFYTIKIKVNIRYPYNHCGCFNPLNL